MSACSMDFWLTYVDLAARRVALNLVEVAP